MKLCIDCKHCLIENTYSVTMGFRQETFEIPPKHRCKKNPKANPFFGNCRETREGEEMCGTQAKWWEAKE